MPRFVILEHDHPTLHWDLMLESGAVLCTWRLSAPPETPGVEVAAERIGDHRPVYLEYEGPVSSNRGSVRRWDRGDYHVVEEEPGRLVLVFEGARVRGRGVLEETPAGATFRREPLPEIE